MTLVADVTYPDGASDRFRIKPIGGGHYPWLLTINRREYDLDRNPNDLKKGAAQHVRGRWSVSAERAKHGSIWSHIKAAFWPKP
jgi:hypothetical protein